LTEPSLLDFDDPGEVSEWLKELAWKASGRVKPPRGFESHPLRLSKWFDRVKKVDRLAERIADAPANLVGRGKPISDSAKRKLYEEGLDGTATVLKAPSKHGVSQVKPNLGRFTVRVEIAGEQPYEVGVYQEFMADEWEQMQPEMQVPCKVDPESHELVWLTPTGFQEPAKQVSGPGLNLGGLLGGSRVTDSSQLIATGRRAKATVLSSEPMGKKAPGTDDEFYLLDLELEADDEPRTWKVNFGMRVPKGAEGMVAKGEELQVAFAAVGDPNRVAVDWPATSNGRFS
jgi:hypothetical protein